MQLSRELQLPASLQDTWNALNDIAVLQACIPGCDALTPGADGEFDLLIVAAVGPVKAKFKGKLRLAEVNPPDSYTLHFEGQGGVAGHAKGTARVELEFRGPGETTLRYTAQATVGGKVAQVGARLVDLAAQKLANDFFGALEQHLRGAPVETT
jgi:carbon monoxide dehydrogenase subunit G